MTIDDLTIGEAKQLASLFGAGKATSVPHPMLGKHCVVRTYSDGVHIGTVSAVDGMEVLLSGARRIWQWKGAFTLSEVAAKGIESSSRLSAEVPEIYLTQAISFTPTSEEARKSYAKCSEK